MKLSNLLQPLSLKGDARWYNFERLSCSWTFMNMKLLLLIGNKLNSCASSNFQLAKLTDWSWIRYSSPMCDNHYRLILNFDHLLTFIFISKMFVPASTQNLNIRRRSRRESISIRSVVKAPGSILLRSDQILEIFRIEKLR